MYCHLIRFALEVAHGIHSPPLSPIKPTQGESTYQNQWGIVVKVTSIDIDTFSDLFLADLQIPFSTGIAEVLERLTEVQWVVVLDGALFDQLLLIV